MKTPATLALLSLLAVNLAHAQQNFEIRYQVEGMVAPIQTDFTTHTFTTCGQTGRFGPSLAQCQSAYNSAEILSSEYNFDVNGGIQQWTVPVDGTYRIETAGAQGGGPFRYTGGKGASMTGTLSLTKGKVLKILVGQQGSDTHAANWGSGGGGGSYVTTDSNTPLIVAGGGGGAGRDRDTYTHGHGGDAITTNTGTHAGNTSGTYGDGNGAGFNGNGETARSFLNGGAGGISSRYNYGGHGGFGGGASNSGHLGGGGGGYHGGIGGTLGSSSSLNGIIPTGGGSFNLGTNQLNQAGANTGHGYVTITYLDNQ